MRIEKKKKVKRKEVFRSVKYSVGERVDFRPEIGWDCSIRVVALQMNPVLLSSSLATPAQCLLLLFSR